jgi:D-amino-acid dehydrogenase
MYHSRRSKGTSRAAAVHRRSCHAAIIDYCIRTYFIHTVKQRQYQKIAVIGAGLSGICTAYFLAQAGCQVTLIEQHGNVAEQASLGNSGLIAAAGQMPSAAPGLRKKILSSLFNADSPILLSPTLSPALWGWLRKWMAQSQLERYRLNKTRMTQAALYGQQLLHQLQQQHLIDYQASAGVVQIFRTDAQLAAATKLRSVLVDLNIAHSLLDAKQLRQLEPNLNSATALAGGWHFPQDGAGNCLFFIKQMKAIVQAMGVQCQFMQTVTALQSGEREVGLTIDGQLQAFDAVVVAAGAGSNKLLKPLGIRIPVTIANSYAAVTSIKNPEYAPHGAVLDAAYKTAIVRIDDRIRITGIIDMQPGRRARMPHPQAMKTLLKIADDWYPDAANYNQASFWSGNVAMLPDGPPLIGATPAPNVFLNIDGNSDGWAGAVGASAALADLIGARQPEIDVSGLQLTRYH